MKHLLAFAFGLMPFLGFAQVVDTADVKKQVDSLVQVCRKLTSQAKYEDALQVIETAKTMSREVFGVESARYAGCVNMQGNVFYSMGKYSKAEPLYWEAKNIREKVLGKEHPDYANSLLNLANVYWRKGEYDKAEALYLELISIREKVLGKEHPDYASSLNNLANLYGNKGEYDKAEALHLEAKNIREKVLGKEHPDYAGSLSNLALVYTKKGEYDKAEALFLEAITIREKVSGKEHPDYAGSLYNLANVYLDKGEYDKAEVLFLEVKNIREKILGKEHPDYVRSLNSLATIYREKGEYDKAEVLFLEVISIDERVLGKKHPNYASSLSNLAIVYRDKGEYDKAEALFLEVKNIREKILGKEHLDYARSLNNLASTYREKGEYDKAEALFLEAKNIREKTLGKEHPDYAWSLNSLASVYSDKGEYDKAEALFLEAKNIREKTLGKEHPDYASSLNKLGLIYRDRGEYDKAATLFLEAKNIREKTLGKEHPDYARSLNNLATIYFVKSEYDKAATLFLEAKNIREKTLGKEHPDYAQSLYNLGMIYRNKGEDDKAEVLYLEAKSIWEKVFGKEHPNYANSLSNLASVYSSNDEYDKAEAFYLEAIAIREKVLGKEHPDYAQSLSNLADAYRDKGDHIIAASYFLSSNTASKSLIQKSASYSSEREMLQYQALFEERFNALLRFTQSHPGDSLIFAAYDNALFLNNALLFNAIAREKGIRLTADSSTRVLHTEWKSCHFQLAKQYALPIAERDSGRVARLEQRANEYEKELARRSTAFVESQRVVRWEEVRDRLRPGEAAIEFIHYSKYGDSTRYAALVLRPDGDPDASGPHWVTLFEERQLTALLRHFQTGKRDIVNRLYDSPSLYELIWKPLEKWLGGVQRVFYAPSGLLHRLSLEGIRCVENQILSEKYDLRRLGSTRQLVTDNSAPTFAAEDAVVYGGVHYDMDSSAIAAANRVWLSEENIEPGDFTGTRGGSESAWNYLKWTEIEAKSVAALLKAAGTRVETRQGYAASEESFAFLGKKSAAPKVLHLATHAFFFPDPGSEVRGEGVRGEISEPVFKMSEHPMVRSGLVLAGANRAWTGGKAPAGMEDGILTAYEISQINLTGTELVVLSACETGLGDIMDNEGVYGLQRAFKIAGAKYLIMSLWQVPDYQTEELMTAFYTEWLEGKKTIPEAFRSARLHIRAKYPEPFDWAGFVLVE